MTDLVDNINAANAANAALFEHCGYQERWRVFPVVDNREMYWCVDAAERNWCKHSPVREAIRLFVEGEMGDGDWPEEHGNHFYSSVIYTNRHLPRWVFRGAIFTMVLEDTQTDGNIWLAVYLTEREVRL